MRRRATRLSSQRGAVLIHVAIALLGLIAFTTFVADYGVMWVSRGQVQTSADAGALSGAISLAFDNSTDFDGAREKARAVAIANGVFGQPPDVQLTDVTFPPCPPFSPGVPDTCVKVDAFRNQLRGNPLPMFFGHMVGVGEQGVRATATAQIVTGTTTECLKPWAIMDRWDEMGASGVNDYPNPDPDFNYSSTFDRYNTRNNQPPQENDYYVPPADGVDGTGFTLPADQGRQFAIKMDTNTNNTVSAGWFRAIRIPRLDGQNGANNYEANIASCGGLPTSFAAPETVCPDDIGNDDMAYWAARGCYATEPGNMIGPTRHGIEELIARDGGARWSGGGITGSAFSPATSSPRVVPVGVIDINHFLSQDPNGANGVLKMVNIYGFFIEGLGSVDVNGNISCCGNGQAVIGRIMTIPSTGTGGSTLPNSSSFLRQVILIR